MENDGSEGETKRVVITGIEIEFLELVAFFAKAGAAMIPAALMLCLLAVAVLVGLVFLAVPLRMWLLTH